MAIEFNFDAIIDDRTEFITATGTGRTPAMHSVTIDRGVQEVLTASAVKMIEAMLREAEADPRLYDPGNSYEATGYLFVPMDGTFSTKANYLHTYPSPPPHSDPLRALPRINLYLARLQDEHGNRISAVKKTSDFGRALKKTGWSRLSNGELILDVDPIFQMADDFDFFIEDDGIYVYRYKSFERVCNLERAINEAVETNIEFISKQSECIDFSTLLDPASHSIRAARALASIRANDYAKDLDVGRVRHYCENLNITLAETNGRLSVESEHLKFLRLIARQILGVELRAGYPETYEALNRNLLV